MDARKVPPRKDGRVIIHFDYDCFYAAVFEAQTPALKSLPFAVQQKHIIVTCNYEARRRGLHKLQLIRDARRLCPDVIIELGEDISRFRDASKELYNFLKAFSWNGKVERLGFDEVWMDVTDIIDYNINILNRHYLSQSFFQTSRQDPTEGFSFDASTIAGHSYPKDQQQGSQNAEAIDEELNLRLLLGSHLALHMRHELEQRKGYTCTVGIATSKLLSKLVGNVNKPKGQTVLLPPLISRDAAHTSNVATFMDSHDIGKVPGIGYKLAQKLRTTLLPDCQTNGSLSVGAARAHPAVNSEMLEKLFRGPGSPHGIGFKIWSLLHGIDDTEVSQAKPVPTQISIEDSYIKLDTMPELLRELAALARSLITRMRIDLLIDDDVDDGPVTPDSVEDEEIAISDIEGGRNRKTKWLAHPRTVRLTTRPRNPLQADGTRVRTFKRISHSCPAPTFLYSRTESVDALADKLVREVLVGMFRHLHPSGAGGWNLSLVNLALTNMVLTAGAGKQAGGRDVAGMLKRQEEVLKDFKVTVSGDEAGEVKSNGAAVMENELSSKHTSEEITADWDVDEGEKDEDDDERCEVCGARMLVFAMRAHRRFHEDGIG